jgi:hypothetical protein
LGRRSRRREHEAHAAPPEPRRRAEPRRRKPRPRVPADDDQPAQQPPLDEPDAVPAARPSRSEAKNAAARERLEPLREGERPRAVTVAALVAIALAVANAVWFAAGAKIGGKRPAAVGVLSYSALMGIAAWGMWRAKYWAVLGMQAILAIAIVGFSILLLRFSTVWDVLIALAVIVPSGTLFWFLVKAMARIQMPERRRR